MARRKIRINNPHWSKMNVGPLPNPFKDVPFYTLENYQKELNMLIGAAQREINRLTAIVTMVAEAINELRDEVSITVTDHAIVRYLERHTDFDIDTVVREIITKAENNESEIAIRERVIITVLPQGERARTDTA